MRVSLDEAASGRAKKRARLEFAGVHNSSTMGIGFFYPELTEPTASLLQNPSYNPSQGAGKDCCSACVGVAWDVEPELPN